MRLSQQAAPPRVVALVSVGTSDELAHRCTGRLDRSRSCDPLWAAHEFDLAVSPVLGVLVGLKPDPQGYAVRLISPGQCTS
jgi:hypothetical protein